MGIWTRLKSFLGFEEVATAAGGLLPGVLQSGLPPRRGTRELLRAYSQNPWLHAVTWKIGVAIAQEHLKVFQAAKPRAQSKWVGRASSATYQPRGATELEAHPLLELLENPNPRFTRSTFFLLLSVYLLTKGEVPVIIERGPDGRPVSLWPVPPHWLQETPHARFPFFRFQWQSWHRTVPDRDVIFFRHPDVEQPYGRGVGTGETLADELDVDEFAAKHLKSWFFNRALPDVFLSVEGVASDEEARRYEEKLRGKHGGVGKAFQVHVTNGKVDLKQVGHTFREQMLPDLRQAARDTALQVYGMPPEIMGIVENSNRATIDGAEVIFTRHVVCPQLAFIADTFTWWARGEYEDPTIAVGFDSPVPEDRAFQFQVMNSQPSLFYKNEFRELAGREPLDEFEGQFCEAKVNPLALPPGAPGAKDPNEEADPESDAEDATEDPEAEDSEAEKSARRFLRALQ